MPEPRCKQCGGRLDRPGLMGCDDYAHEEPPDLSWRVCQAIEADLDDRRGFRVRSLPDEVLDGLRDAWWRIARGILAPPSDRELESDAEWARSLALAHREAARTGLDLAWDRDAPERLERLARAAERLGALGDGGPADG